MISVTQNIWQRGIALLLLFLVAPCYGASTLLEADQAFDFDAKVRGQNIELTWQIAQGYYLYRDKIKIRTDFDTQLATPILPQGENHNDAFFGDSVVYRQQLNLTVPITVAQNRAFSVQVDYQGCADVGVCYPPLTKVAKLIIDDFKPKENTVLAGALGLLDSAKVSVQSAIAGITTNKADDILPVEQAFIFDMGVVDKTNVALSWQIAPGYYLYDDKFSVEAVGADVLAVNKPSGEEKNDAFFGVSRVHRNFVSLAVLLGKPLKETVDLTITYQGCADVGVCYPPQRIVRTVALTDVAKIAQPAENKKTAVFSKSNLTALLDQGRIAQLLDQAQLSLVMLTFFVFGLLLSLTPCVLPMIPILSATIVSQGEKTSGVRAFLLALVFVLSMATVYAGVGAFSGYIGASMQLFFQNQWALIAVSIVFILLALSMFGLFDIQLPKAVQEKMTKKSTSGGFLTVAVMGMLSAIIVGPCVAPPLAATLIYIGQTGDAMLGALALFVMSLGMGMPLLLIAIGAGKLLPKAGAWMGAVKGVIGVIMLAMAIYWLTPVVGDFIALILWAILITVTAIYLGALDSLTAGISPWRRLWKALGLILLGYGVLLWFLVLRGGGDMMAPLSHWRMDASQTKTVEAVDFINVGSSQSLQKIIDDSGDKLVMVDFYADWCIACRLIEKRVFLHPEVAPKLAEMTLVKVDLTHYDAAHKEMMARFSVIGPPTMLFFKNGKALEQMRLVGEFDVDFFLKNLAKQNAIQ